MTNCLNVTPALVRLDDISLHRTLAQFERDTELPPLTLPSTRLPPNLLNIWLLANPVLVVKKRSAREDHYYCVGGVHAWRTAKRDFFLGCEEFPVQILSNTLDKQDMCAFYVAEMVCGHALYSRSASDVRSLWAWLNHPQLPEGLNLFDSKKAFGCAMQTNVRGWQ